MSTMLQLIASQRDAIIQLWTERAGQAASARGLTSPELRNLMPAYLASLADLGEPTRAARLQLVEANLGARLRQGFSLAEIIEELLLLGACIAQICGVVPPRERPDPSELEPILLELQKTAASVTELFTEYLLEDQQAEKGHLRRLRAIAAAARGRGGEPSLRDRLGEVLRVVLDAVAAQGGALLLADGGRLSVVASFGPLEGSAEDLAGDPLTTHLAAGDPGGGLVEDVPGSPLRDVGALPTSGIRSLLGVRLPSYGEPLVGVLYVARTGEPFAMRDARRLESLSDVLAVLLDNAAL